MYPLPFADARVRVFASASSWIEGAAIEQVRALACNPGILAIAAMPDLHPGHKGPVGCATLTDGVVLPATIGTDIGCGVALWRLSCQARRLKIDRAVRLLERLDDDWTEEAIAAGTAAGLCAAADHLGSLGTIGGGNHFAELQIVDAVLDAGEADGLEVGDRLIAVHCGSRSFGAAVFARHAGDGKGLDLNGTGADYLAEHDTAMAYARLNRHLVAERAARLLGLDGAPWIDVPHNHAEVTHSGVLHRKGASPADKGLAPVLGSRGAFSYLVKPVSTVDGSLASLAHGAGRKRDRAATVARQKSASRAWKERPNPVGNRVICGDRKLAAEEAPEAYKDVARVMADLEDHGLATVVARLRPLVTFKTTGRRRDD